MELNEAPDLYERVIHEDHEKFTQVRLVINTFRGIEYMSLRKYYLSFEGEWMPSNEGITMPLTFSNSKELFAGLIEILSLAESKEMVEEEFRELIHTLYVK